MMSSQEGDRGAPSAPEHDPLIGQTVGGRFLIKGRIARGGMACVYSATQTQVDRPVAIKVLRPNLDKHDGSDADFRRRFLQEASILSRLQHPNLVTLLDYGQITEASGEHYYIAMEYLRGETLSRRFRTRGRLDIAQTIRIARQVGRGLREAHRQGFIHRDLKPSNIMLVPEDDENDIVKLIDFGIGKAVNHAAREAVSSDFEQEEMTRVGLLLGSPRYMAPEQIRGESVEPRTDLYGLGIVLFQALTGRLPFEGKSQVDMMLAHCSVPAPPLDDYLELPAASLSELVADLLKKTAAERPNVDEFLARLATVEQDLFESVGLAGPTLLGARFTIPPSDRLGSGRPPPPSGLTRGSKPPSRRPSPPPRPTRSEPATVVTTGLLATEGLAAPRALDPALLDVPPLTDTRPTPAPFFEASSRPPIPPRQPSFAALAALPPAPLVPSTHTAKPTRPFKWLWLALPALIGLVWLALRQAPSLESHTQAAHPAVPSAPASKSFVLSLDSTPTNAVVSENGTVLGHTPLRVAIERTSVGAAPRRFIIEHEGHASYTHQQSDSDGNVDVVATLAPLATPPSERKAPRARAKARAIPEGDQAASVPVSPTPAPKPARGLDINLER